MTNSDLIFMAEVKPKLSKDKTVEENFKIAFSEANGHWLISQYNDEQKEFEAAVLTVSSFYGIGSPEFERIKQEMKYINALFRTPGNVPIDWNQLFGDDKNFKPLLLVKMWKEIRDGN